MKYTELKDAVKRVKLAKQYGGYFHLGRCQYGFHIGLHKPEWSDNCKQRITVSGYYGSDKTYLYLALCKKYKIPIIDTRKVSFEDAFELIAGPSIDSSRDGADNWCLTVNQYITRKEHIKGFKSFNVRENNKQLSLKLG
jgi:hypothetical protein